MKVSIIGGGDVGTSLVRADHEVNVGLNAANGGSWSSAWRLENKG